MTKNYKRIIMVTLVLGVMIGVITGCGGAGDKATNKPEESQQAEGIPVETISAQSGQVAKHITVTGTAKAAKSAQLTPQLQETVDEVLVTEGQQVAAGEKLIQLDQENIKAQIAETKAGLEVAQAGLEELLAGSRQGEIDKLQAQLNQAEANYQQAKRDYQRSQKLFEREAISEQKLESAKTQKVSAKNNYQSLKESLKMAQKGPTAEQITRQQASLQQSRARLDTAQLNLDKSKIKAPFPALISTINVEEGEMVGNQPVISIVDLSSIKLETHVSENNVNQLKVGERVTVDFNALDNKLQGTIQTISPSLDQQQQGYPIEIKVNNSGNLIKSGMYAEVEIETERSSGNLVIPKQSVLQENGSSYVFVVEDDKAEKKEVTTGLTTTDKVEILSGITDGEQVITAGSEKVTAGYEVRVVGGGGQ
ncbi:MAG: efflux RND transporter periplasmic adaptor subunit [Bacillota bacterium]